MDLRMMNRFDTIFLASAILIFVFIDFELLDLFIIALVAFYTLYTSIKRFMALDQKALLKLLSVFLSTLSFMLLSRHLTITEVDHYAYALINHNNCRLSIETLKKTDPEWTYTDSTYLAERKFGKYGYSRKINYQDNGLLRFGFPYEEEKTLWLKNCEQLESGK